jgi:hypothetical protein
VGGVVYRGTALPSWVRGHYFFADFCQDPPNIWSFRVVGGAVTEFTDWTDELAQGGFPIQLVAAIGVDGLGEMYLAEWRFPPNGRIYRIVPDSTALNVSLEPTLSGSLLSLSEAVPNPFSASTEFALEVARPVEVDLAVYEAGGRLVSTLRLGQLRRGNHPLTWDGRSRSGEKLASGTYFLRVRAGGHTVTRPVTLLR